MKRSIVKKVVLCSAILALSACGAVDRLSNIGTAPAMTPIKDVKAPATEPSLAMSKADVSPQKQVRGTSLWRAGARGFFKDQRARRVGDILTVNVSINDSAQIGNSSTTSRSGSESAGLPNFFGLEKAIPYLYTKTGDANISPVNSAVRGAFDSSSLVGGSSSSGYTGNGSVNRSESINLSVAATVTDILPNGNLVIQARQETVVNFERRDLILTGIIRPEDISSSNTILHAQIAQARLFYGGKGKLSDVQQPRYGQQVFDVLFPF
ncbi:flagellar basal body L-ring protein FlgH [Temperatibacter marinus]|uniref:Flagellar L-ring protein n=1 Tax=Temperatibacter marinus TaxID=1456591 RepID=A0AA52EGJ8_9PROT|nr:flagellar basal body L-ring protein FlgH [Temperatibacter marinus]WND01676.1 flagellar basal body L-ring protein FlgH [Temperatibacter marinus]